MKTAMVCLSEGMTLTIDIFQMKFFNAIAAAAFAGLPLLTALPASSGTVNVETPSTYSHQDTSVRQLKIRGRYGRYITFIGRSTNSWQGTSGYYNPGSQGSVSCSTYGSYTSCNRIGYVAPSYSPGTVGGSANRNYVYELDCRDLTFDRKGDKARGIRKRGWMSVLEDPTANAVAQRYCPIIDSLPKGFDIDDDE